MAAVMRPDNAWGAPPPYHPTTATPRRPHSKSLSNTTPRPTPRPRSTSAGTRPLATLQREARRAHRSPHLKKSAIPGPDTIDRLDNILGGTPYHHEGPFDATLRARQIPGRSPVEALAWSNAKAIAATPRENIIDCLEKHKPLQGTASVPVGMRTAAGQVMGDYEEVDLMVESGYRRYPGLDYLDEDKKGKGEPGYTLDKFDKQQKAARKARKTQSLGRNEYEPYSDNKTAGVHTLAVPATASGYDGAGVRRNKSSAGRMEGGESFGDKLKKRFNLKRRLS
ncbi:hypothetical protein P167DRAFT_604215 [Morchella conica CCBAS932]|uniref:Pal1-domain-containing protein n=1 Tax=Morchella conica CCBAS932 TaxID=1392247 RepID=A0A3N4KV15_9PEZI|nr:hypothetical protein P167DRAFT_604215 [Morchella conica CCBAS932]